MFSCVIWTLCIPNMEFQLVNPTTQVALFAICVGNCTTLQSIKWNIYSGQIINASNLAQWTPFNQTNTWFFGKRTLIEKYSFTL
jgi:hypothetical protein